MRRREFITLLGGAAAWPRAARAQQPDRVRRVGVMMVSSDGDLAGQSQVAAFQQTLEQKGWTVGRNLQIDYRWGVMDVERGRRATAELLSTAPDVILANGRPALVALQQATRTVPIVFTIISEPVAQGFVQSLSHPGGNITGFTQLEPSVAAKWLGLLQEIAPRVTRVAFMFNPETSPVNALFSRSVEEAAPKSGVELVAGSIREPADIEELMAMLAREPGGGLIVPQDSFTSSGRRKLIIELAARYRLPVIYGYQPFVYEGGLVTYGLDFPALYRQAAVYIDRILRGEKPADLPVQQPTKFELIISLKTAKALGLAVPPSLLALADEVIE